MPSCRFLSTWWTTPSSSPPTRRKRVIDIGCQRLRDGSVQFSVRDYGPGVPAHQMKKIFRLFYRSENELTRETVGTGIGLALVHQLARSMGGQVDAGQQSGAGAASRRRSRHVTLDPYQPAFLTTARIFNPKRVRREIHIPGIHRAGSEQARNGSKGKKRMQAGFFHHA